MPGQEQRSKSVRSKLKRHRPGVSRQDGAAGGRLDRARHHLGADHRHGPRGGAKKVYFASAAPPVRYPNVYGIDMPDTSELVAAGHTDEEVRGIIGADWLIYQDLDDLE